MAPFRSRVLGVHIEGAAPDLGLLHHSIRNRHSRKSDLTRLLWSKLYEAADPVRFVRESEVSPLKAQDDAPRKLGMEIIEAQVCSTAFTSRILPPGTFHRGRLLSRPAARFG